MAKSRLHELSEHGLHAVGGFTPLLLHVGGHDPIPEVEPILESYVASGAKVLILSAVTGSAGYDTRPPLDADGWTLLLSNHDRDRRRGAAGAGRLLDLFMPGHRSSPHRWHRSGGASPASA